MLKAVASSFGPSSTAPADWAVAEFGRAQLGDARRTQRLLLIATAFAQQPTVPLPQACGPGPATQGAYRFFENDDIAPAALRQSHHQATLERARHHPIVLAIQDTTTLNYSTHPRTEGLGLLGSHSEKVIGLHLHCTLAVTPTGQPLGLLHSAVWARDKKKRGLARARHRKPSRKRKAASGSTVSPPARPWRWRRVRASTCSCAAGTTANSTARIAACGTPWAG